MDSLKMKKKIEFGKFAKKGFLMLDNALNFEKLFGQVNLFRFWKGLELKQIKLEIFEIFQNIKIKNFESV
jgi:hypothetical protein